MSSEAHLPWLSSLYLYRAQHQGGSWIHLTCFFWTLQMCSILSRSRRGTPRESLPLLLRSSVSSRSRRRMVASSPQVLLRQCRASSSLVRCLLTSSSVSAGQPWDNSSSLFALRSIETSAASHSKMHADSRDMKMGYS